MTFSQETRKALNKNPTLFRIPFCQLRKQDQDFSTSEGSDPNLLFCMVLIYLLEGHSNCRYPLYRNCDVCPVFLDNTDDVTINHIVHNINQSKTTTP